MPKHIPTNWRKIHFFLIRAQDPDIESNDTDSHKLSSNMYLSWTFKLNGMMAKLVWDKFLEQEQEEAEVFITAYFNTADGKTPQRTGFTQSRKQL